MKVGILGGGQLARMLAMAAHRLGVEPWVVDPAGDAPARAVSRFVQADLQDPAAWSMLASCDVVTAELDHAPGDALEWLAGRVAVHPGPGAFAVAGDRWKEKRLFRRLEIETARHASVSSVDEIDAGLAHVGLPALLKTRFDGYDGKGQRRVRTRSEAEGAWLALGGRPAILESVVPFDREISILAARSREGDVRFWNPVENRHRGGILRHSLPLDPAPEAPFWRDGREQVRRILTRIDYVGVIAVEFFDVGGRLLANEVACRVHNSGHWTEEGAETSQFENHLRAILGWPLGGTRSLEPTAMINLIGALPPSEALLKLPGARLHLYGKAAAPGRKLGHVTLRAERREILEREIRSGIGIVGAAS